VCVCVIRHIHSLFTDCCCLERPHWMSTGSMPPSRSTNHRMALPSPLPRCWQTASARSFSSLQMNYEITKTQSTTRQIHPSPFVFTVMRSAQFILKPSLLMWKYKSCTQLLLCKSDFWYGNDLLLLRPTRSRQLHLSCRRARGHGGGVLEHAAAPTRCVCLTDH